MTKLEESDGMAEQALNRFSQHTGEKPVVLIADDSRVVRVSLRNILKDDCQLIETEDGEQAWRRLCENPSIELVFSDLSMPNLDGRGLLTKLRNAESKHLADLPFIIVTGNEASAEITRELENLGATGMVNKPFDPDLIKSFVTNLSAQPREEELSDTQDTDPQTDFLDNTADRTQFMETASRELSFAIRNKNELALALVHIDQFSGILDHYSEPAVEHILLAMHEIIRQHIHPDDTLAYFGGGRFAILRPASNAIGTRYLGRRILEDLSARHFYLGESDQTVSASIGISAPDIKPGTLLKDLLGLAEGRLTAAMDNGGSKVVDKGNENLTPVSTTQDTSELSNAMTSQPTDSAHSLTRSPTEIHRLAVEQVAEIKAKYTTNQDQDTTQQASQLIKYKQTIEELTEENRQLIGDVERWKKQSSEAEHLRRQLFEVESQQQQIKLKFNELQETNAELVQRNEAVERENRRLIDEEEERTASLRQAHHIVEDENRRLENQINELISRAEKAELESLKSNQLVSSLRENGNLLHMQLDQLQQQLNELQESQQTNQSKPEIKESKPEQEQASQLQSDSVTLNEIYESELSLSAMPNTEASDSKPVSVHLFPEKDQISSKQKSTKNTAIPPFRVEPKPLLFKNGLNFSSFTIASIILGVLLFIGGIYLYQYMSNEPHNETVDTHQATPTKKTQSLNLVIPQELPVTSSEVRTVKQKFKPAPSETATTDAKEVVIADELRLEKEWTLRQMAEEEFSRKLDRPVTDNAPASNEEPEPVIESFPQANSLSDLSATPEVVHQPDAIAPKQPENLQINADTIVETAPPLVDEAVTIQTP